MPRFDLVIENKLSYQSILTMREELIHVVLEILAMRNKPSPITFKRNHPDLIEVMPLFNTEDPDITSILDTGKRAMIDQNTE